jgi:hypothetical protein
MVPPFAATAAFIFPLCEQPYNRKTLLAEFLNQMRKDVQPFFSPRCYATLVLAVVYPA